MALSFTIILLGSYGLSIVLFFVFIITLSEIFAMPFMLNYALNRPAPEKRGQYMAFYSIAFGFSHIIGPSLGMNIAEKFDFYTLFGILAILSILIAWGYFMLRRRM